MFAGLTNFGCGPSWIVTNLAMIFSLSPQSICQIIPCLAVMCCKEKKARGGAEIRLALNVNFENDILQKSETIYICNHPRPQFIICVYWIILDLWMIVFLSLRTSSFASYRSFCLKPVRLVPSHWPGLWRGAFNCGPWYVCRPSRIDLTSW